VVEDFIVLLFKMPVFEVIAGANAMTVDMSEVTGRRKLTAKNLLAGGQRFSVDQLIKKVADGEISSVDAATYAAERIMEKRYKNRMNSYIDNLLQAAASS
jgi:hypothetical protein